MVHELAKAASAAVESSSRRRRAQGAALASAVALLLAACAAAPTPSPEAVALEQRLSALEGRVERLERYATSVPAPPLRSRDEIVRHIEALEARRAELLQRYTAAHPDVREVDLQLRLRRLQLEVLDQAGQSSR